jgi:hypothetical protein
MLLCNLHSQAHFENTSHPLDCSYITEERKKQKLELK